MRSFSEKEKHIIRELLREEKEVYHVTDFIRQLYPGGYFEISSFQQQLLYTPGESSKDQVMKHLMEVLDLIGYLRQRGYVSSWENPPISDNTVHLGEKAEGEFPTFLPDIQVATKLLQLANRQFIINDGLRKLARRRFRSMRRIQHQQLLGWMIFGFFTLASIGLFHVHKSQRLIEETSQNLRQLKDENAAMMSNQQLNRAILDSVSMQSDHLMTLTLQIARNTDQIQEIGQVVANQQTNVADIRRQQWEIKAMITENRKALKATDSLLNRPQ